MNPDPPALFINGCAVSTAGRIAVENPATGEVVAEAPDATRTQLDDAFAGAHDALAGWAADAEFREKSLLAGADALAARSEEIAELITTEQGKPLAEARVEVAGTLAALRYFAASRLDQTVLQDDARSRVVVRRRPVGVVAAITPWNSPVMVAGGMKVAPALAAGNTMVLKPSPITPLSTLRMGALLNTALPPGVLNVVSGGDDLGPWMTSHPVPRMVTFTGSPATGRAVARSAAPDLKRVVLELGGNDPAVVLDDVDATAAVPIVEALFWAAFGNAGQTCVAVKRLYVPTALLSAVVSQLAALADQVVVGDGRDAGTHMGPLTTAVQRSIVEDLLADAVRSGGRIATGGTRIDRPGNFLRPAIVDGVDDGVAIVDREQFGPALPVVAYDDLDALMSRINASDYGLGGSVWSTDSNRANAVADRISSGTTWVNTHRSSAWPTQPTAGLRGSGLGSEMGRWGLESFTDLSVRHESRHVVARAVGLVLDA